MKLPEISKRLIAAGISLFDVSKNNIGIEGPGAAAIGKAVIETGITSLTISSTGKSREPKTYTIAAGMSALNLSNLNLGPADAVLISSLMTSAFGKKAMAAISSFCISDNPGILSAKLTSDGKCEQPDGHLDEFKQLLDAIGELQNLSSLNLAGIGMGPQGAVMTSAMLRSEKVIAAAISLFDISGNFIFGSKDKGSYNKTQVHDVGKDETGFAAICDALSGCSALKSIYFSNIGMGPKGAMLTSSMLRSERLNAAISLFPNADVIRDEISTASARPRFRFDRLSSLIPSAIV
eukprot:SAG11_NODE_1263_length_5356_cov_3.268404_1_plen_293_part_00